MSDATCIAGDCNRPIKVISRKLCAMHYTRLLRSGGIGESTPRRIPNAGNSCKTASCTAEAQRRGMCRKHYRYALLSERELCSVPGCEKPRERRDLCGMHFERQRATGSVGEAAQRDPRYGSQACSVDGCRRRAAAQGMCISHCQYTRLTGREASVFTVCPACAATVDLRRPDGRFRPNRPLLCLACLASRPSGRWCMSVHQLALRDGTECSVCLLPVDLALKRPDPLSPSVDHVVPRSRGGADAPENVALAHLVCNIRKGVRVAA